MPRDDIRAMKVYYNVDGIIKTQILCPECRKRFYNFYPDARTQGEYFDVNECEICRFRRMMNNV